ncbi:MAG: anthranilate synthase component I family protein [Pedobacter sp.]|nr:MAG: anthranilate synthase component I family protein [Pedobacter sp.]
MKKYTFKAYHLSQLADTTTPVSVYLRLRDAFPNCILLESSDYHSRENSTSYICAEPIAGITFEDGKLKTYFPDGSGEIADCDNLSLAIETFKAKFNVESGDQLENKKQVSAGLFGYFTWDCIPYFEDITFTSKVLESAKIPPMQYHFYRYIIAIDHFKNEVSITQHVFEEDIDQNLNLKDLAYRIQHKSYPVYAFETVGAETSNLSDTDFIALVEKMKMHIYRGDVFQIVPSRAFKQNFQGDEFNVYRCLRSINPSPYLFYFDYGSFKLFGSSPEAQITIKDNTASVYPIAGTFQRTGQESLDREIAIALKNDPKESAEHVMLVDLARNDLSRHCNQVEVAAYKEVQYYSHLIHLVSKVSGQVDQQAGSFKVVTDTYPAGTLSGAPKYKAMQLLDAYEGQARQFYAGAIGYMGFNHDFNHAIMIRTFLSKQNNLHYRAGAGIVADSVPEKELTEVNHKIAALRKAITQATQLI